MRGNWKKKERERARGALHVQSPWKQTTHPQGEESTQTLLFSLR